MSEKKSFYITTTLPYVNAEPHIGFAMEIIQADVIARYKKLQGYDVFFNTGTDEHGQKVYRAALSENKDPKQYCDELAEKFKELQSLLGLTNDLHFIRTTSEQHKKAAQKMWVLCKEAGFIDKKPYKIKYCTGCELEKSDSELENGKCPLHSDRGLEIREEDNYFFKFGAFGDKLSHLYSRGDFSVIPKDRLNEIKALISRGLEDFSISRLKSKMPWGVEVPGDSNHVMYVWFDALTSYISTLGWPDDKENFEKYWRNGTTVQFAGKDQVRQQVAMWQAMLIASDLPNTKDIVIHGFLNFGGQKMSKSLGNVISPKDMVDKFGPEATRAMLAGVNQFEDTDVSIGIPNAGFDLTYNANLANGLGNLVARIMKLAETHLTAPVKIAPMNDYGITETHLDNYEIKKAVEALWAYIGHVDVLIQMKKPWKTKDQTLITELVKKLSYIAYSLEPLMPKTSQKIISAIHENKMPEALFPRKD